MNILIIAPIIIIVIWASIFIILILLNKKKRKKNKTKITTNNKILYKRLKILSFHKWSKNKSGIVLASGIKQRNSINNKFVIKNLNKSENKKIKKINLKDLAVVKSQQLSGIIIAPSGSGKTQALLLPTIIYNTYSKDKPNMIITDPKPEILNKTKSYLVDNGYRIINLSTVNIKASNNEYVSDFWNPMDNIIFYHKQLLQSNDRLEQQEILSNIGLEITFLINIFNQGIKGGVTYFDSNNLIFIKFILAIMLLKVELGEWDYSKVNFANLLANINSYNEDDISEIVKVLKSRQLNDIYIKTLRLVYLYLAWAHERGDNLKSFRTGGAEKLSIFDNNYFNLLTCKSTFNIDEIILSNKPFAIFLTVNTSSTATEAEKKLLNIYLELINKKIDYYKKINKEFKDKTFWWMLDEIGNIPKLNFLESIITYGRDSNTFALPIFQSAAQLEQNYSHAILENCAYRILFNNSNTQMSRQIKDQEGFEEKTLPSQNVIKIDNVNASDVNNIESGYIGLWTAKKNSKDKVFYTLPITYYYMVNHFTNDNIQPTTHPVYDLDNHIGNLNFKELKIILEIKTKKINKQNDILAKAKTCIDIIKNNSIKKLSSYDETLNEAINSVNEAINNDPINIVKDIKTKEEYKTLDNNLNELNDHINKIQDFINADNEQTLNYDDDISDDPIKVIPETFIIDWDEYNHIPKQELDLAKDKLLTVNNLFANFKKLINIDSNDDRLKELEQNYFDLKILFLKFNNQNVVFDKLEEFIENVKLMGVNIFYEE